MKIALLTSDSLRHKYIASMLAEKLELQLIAIEEKSAAIQDTSALNLEDASFSKKHFLARAESEKAFFGKYDNFPVEVPVLKLPHNSINSMETFKSIQKAAPDYIILFGTSIIKEPLLQYFEENIINLHLGLSPYYRGSATNLYPYFEGAPECIGATIHLATKRVDKGAILHQFRPEIRELDTQHDIGNQTIKKAGEILPKVLQLYGSGKISPKQQLENGKLIRNKDITTYVLREIYRKFEEGLISSYLKDKKTRDGKKPIIDQLYLEL